MHVLTVRRLLLPTEASAGGDGVRMARWRGTRLGSRREMSAYSRPNCVKPEKGKDKMGSEPILPREIWVALLFVLTYPSWPLPQFPDSTKDERLESPDPSFPSPSPDYRPLSTHLPSCSTTTSILIRPQRTISLSPYTSASHTPSRSYNSSSAPLRPLSTSTPLRGYPRPHILTTLNPTALPMTLLPLPSPAANHIAPPPPWTVPRLSRCPLIIVTRPSTTRIAPVNVGSASGVTRSIRKTWPVPVRPLPFVAFRYRASHHLQHTNRHTPHSSTRFSVSKAKKSRWRFGQQRIGRECVVLPILGLPFLPFYRRTSSHSQHVLSSSIFRSHIRRASHLGRHSAHIPVPLVTRTSLPVSASNNTLLRAEMPTKHVASPSSTGLSE